MEEDFEEPLYKAAIGYSRTFNYIVDNGCIPLMGHKAFAVLSVIKRFIGYYGEPAYPTQEQIATLAGVSRSSVGGLQEKLTELGFLERYKEQGKRNYKYRVLERPTVLDNDDKPVGLAMFEYVPKTFEQKRRELKEVFRQELGDALPPGLHVERLNINLNLQLNQGSGDCIQINTVDKAVKQTVAKIMEQRKKECEEKKGERGC